MKTAHTLVPLLWLPAAPINLAVSAMLAALMGAIYRLALGPLGRFLQRREKAILQAVTVAAE